MAPDDLAARLRRGDASVFPGDSAAHSLGWLRHRERYVGDWLVSVEAQLPRRHPRTLVLGMGGSSSPARFFAEAAADETLSVLDTSNPDTIAATDFSGATVIASSKSGTTVETQTLLAHALARGLDPKDLVVVSDPGTSLAELAHALGALVIEGDPATGGRFSALSPFGLVPALYAGWSAETLIGELAGGPVSDDEVAFADDEARDLLDASTGPGTFVTLRGDPVLSGGSLWLEQLIAETTGKSGVGVIPLAGHGGVYRPREIMHFHLVAALLARRLGVDPFNQPDVERAKRAVFELLSGARTPRDAPVDVDGAFHDALYRTLQVYGPLAASARVARLREAMTRRFAPTTANLGPRYLHSTGQLHTGGPEGVYALQVLLRPSSPPQRIEGRAYSFHDLHRAQADSDRLAMLALGRRVAVLEVDSLDEVDSLFDLAS